MTESCVKRNTAIEALRFIFICFICLWHWHELTPWLMRGYLAVEFFFILSGYFIYQSFKHHPDIGVFDFFWNKVKRFFAPFFISWILLILLDRRQHLYVDDFTPTGILLTYYKHFQDLFFCQYMGLTEFEGINRPLWFISVLLFGGTLLYSILRNFPRLSTSLIFPSICVFLFPYILCTNHYCFQSSSDIISQPWMLRGIAEMSLGIMTAVFINHKKFLLLKHIIIVNIMSLFSFVGIILLILAKCNLDYLMLFFVFVIVLSCVLDQSLFQSIFRYRFLSKLGGLSMYMYFIHYFVLSCFWIVLGSFPSLRNVPNVIELFLYLSAVVLSAYFLKKVSVKVSLFFSHIHDL